MIPVNPEPWEPDTWRLLLKRAVRTSDALLQALGLSDSGADPTPGFPVRVPAPFLSRMRRGDPRDPLLLQVLASLSERLVMPGFVADAVNEIGQTRAPGLIQKYAHRALLIASPACAVHCRYCFRREFPYEDHPPGALQDALEVIRSDDSLTEIILSGGDPLTLSDEALTSLFNNIVAVPHIRRVRLHTRLPVVLPQRTTRALLQTLAASAKPVVMVVHVNHARELDIDTLRAFTLLRHAGVTLLNQAVLLKDINDTADAQCDLAQTLFEQGVLPYYLHLLDRVRGTHSFEVAEPAVQTMLREMHARLPGYLLPRLVREIGGEPGKRLIVMEPAAQDNEPDGRANQPSSFNAPPQHSGKSST
jgi:L-lysine 2,3-aminomutase